MNLLLSIILLLSPHISIAETLSDGNEFLIDERRVTPKPTEDLQFNSDSKAEDLGETGDFDVTQMGGLEGTNSGQSKGKAVQMLGLAMGAAFAGICPRMGGQWACPLAAMSFKDALTGSSAKQAAFQTGTYIDPNHGMESYKSNFETNSDQALNAQAADGLEKLEKMGYSVNSSGGVTGPDGQTFSVSDYGSVDDLIAKGLTPKAAEKVMDKMSSIKTAAANEVGMDPEAATLVGEEGSAVAATKTKEPAEGSLNSFGTSRNANANRLIHEVEYRKKNKKKLARLPASQAAELSRNYNGDPIGIGMANLFLIVHKKYEQKKSEKEFFNSEY